MAATTSFDVGLAPRPPHVPEALVRDFDYRNNRLFEIDPHRAFLEALGEAPDLFWSPRYGGHWVLKRFEDIRQVARDHERFQHYPASLPALVGRPRPILPMEVEPPFHARYRMALAPLFAPAAVRRMQPAITAMAEALIDGFAAEGKVEFVSAYCTQLPVRMFLRLIGVPEDHCDWLRGLHNRAFGHHSEESKRAAGAEVNAWLEATLDERRGSPGDDILGTLIKAEPGEAPSADRNSSISDSNSTSRGWTRSPTPSA